MSLCRKYQRITISKYLFIFVVLICLVSIAPKAFSQPDTTARKERPQPPAHPKPPSIKEMLNKINIFKKHKEDPPAATTEPVKQPGPAPLPPPPAPVPQPSPVNPKTAVKHTSTRKKTKKVTPSTDKKKPKTDKPPQSLI